MYTQADVETLICIPVVNLLIPPSLDYVSCCDVMVTIYFLKTGKE